jgi:hypothetical protein
MILAPTLLLNAGSGAAIARPTFSRDFAGEKTLNNGTGPAITFTRASNATFFDANGTLQTAANDTPRFDHSGGSSLGLLIEEARTNSIRNSQAGGSTNGVIGSGGVMPTNWATVQGTLAVEVVGTGTSTGLSYVDIKFSGTTSTTTAAVYFDTTTNIVAAPSQTWTGSYYAALIAGSSVGVNTFRAAFLEYDDSSNLLTSGNTNHTLTSSLVRYSGTRTLADAGTLRVRFGLGFTFANGATIDLTLRIAAPQLEQGAFPTSHIPTTTAAATRAADSAVVTPISSFYNQSEGTLFAEASRYQVASGGQLFGFRDTDTNLVSIIYGIGSPTQMRFDVVNTTTQAQLSTSTSAVASTTYKHGASYAANDFEYYLNGTRTGTGDQLGTLPAVTTMAIGAGKNTGGSTFGQNNGHIRKLAYWPRRLSNTLLQQLTT